MRQRSDDNVVSFELFYSVRFLFNRTIFTELLQVRPVLKSKLSGIAGAGVFTGRIMPGCLS